MLKQIGCLLLWMVCSTLSAQISIKGIATKISSSSTPVEGVEIILGEGSPCITDSEGRFTIELPHAKAGDMVSVCDVYKKGMELVNEKEVEEWVASEDIVYKIVLCNKGYIESARRKFYNIGRNNYQKNYSQKLKELKLQCEQNSKDSIYFGKRLKELNNEYDRQMKVLKYYADKFARINKDELQETERKAIELVEQGDVDGAIRIYEEMKIYEKFNDRMTQRDSLRENITTTRRMLQRLIDMYMNEGSKESEIKADSIRMRLTEMEK